ncbi:hypothetical protein DERF_014920 [Dermatophagoides farinae]|uniref:Transmembrane protein n=1 Tax=Dermatophagoides farinae TaxID=6954 RepID=A0A922L1Q8_DERFA|nr:hypothetical protein DERF_014920 [Dermatophagoides farinae]
MNETNRTGMNKKKFTPPSSARSIVIVALAIINHLIIDLKLNDHHHHQHNHQTPSQATTDEIQKEMIGVNLYIVFVFSFFLPTTMNDTKFFYISKIFSIKSINYQSN